MFCSGGTFGGSEIEPAGSGTIHQVIGELGEICFYREDSEALVYIGDNQPDDAPEIVITRLRTTV